MQLRMKSQVTGKNSWVHPDCWTKVWQLNVNDLQALTSQLLIKMLALLWLKTGGVYKRDNKVIFCVLRWGFQCKLHLHRLRWSNMILFVFIYSLWFIHMVWSVCRSHLLCIYITQHSGVAAYLQTKFRSLRLISKCLSCETHVFVW